MRMSELEKKGDKDGEREREQITAFAYISSLLITICKYGVAAKIFFTFAAVADSSEPGRSVQCRKKPPSLAAQAQPLPAFAAELFAAAWPNTWIKDSNGQVLPSWLTSLVNFGGYLFSLFGP